MRNIILIAPPAAGKGTQAKLIEKKYNIPHISTGDLLRNEIEKNNNLSLEIQNLIDNGQFVSDKIVLELLISRINLEDCSKGYILDGFPRNLKQAQMYDKYLEKNNQKKEIVILINISKELGQSRIGNRIICSKCGKVYNLNSEKLKPQNNEICDNCGNKLKRRKDDNNETYEIRYNKYVEDTEPIINYYQQKNILHIVDGNADVETIYHQIKDIINKYSER